MRLFVPFHWCALCCWSTPRYQRATDGRRAFTPAQRDFSPWGQMWGTVFSWQDMKCSRGLRNNSCGASLFAHLRQRPGQTFEVPQACKSQNISWTRPKLPSAGIQTTRSTISAHSLPLICFLCKCNMLMFICWRKLDSFHQTHRRTSYRPNASGVQIHEEFLHLLAFTFTRLVLALQFSQIIAKMRQ